MNLKSFLHFLRKHSCNKHLTDKLYDYEIYLKGMFIAENGNNK